MHQTNRLNRHVQDTFSAVAWCWKVDHTAHYTIIVLLFIFGVSIGANHDLISNIGYFGWQAFVIAVLGMIGSFGTAYMFNRFINNKEQNNNER